MKCNNCNFENEPNAVFCSNCGKNLFTQDADSNEPMQSPESSEPSAQINPEDQQSATQEPVIQQPYVQPMQQPVQQVQQPLCNRYSRCPDNSRRKRKTFRFNY